MNEMVAPIENRRIDPRILPEPERGIPSVAGEQQPEDPAPLRQREPLLLSGRLNDAPVRSHEALKDPGGLDPGSVPPAVKRAVPGGGPMAFPHFQIGFPAARILEDQGAFPDIRQDFDVAGGEEFEFHPGRQPIFPEALQGSESVVAGIKRIVRIE